MQNARETLLLSTVSSLSYGYASSNRLIEGDNLQILGLLPAESCDLIYCDPPYGTGKQFRYNDNWKTYATRRVEEAYVTEYEVGQHAHWINFMAARLRLMKRILKPGGVIAISIGKEELFRLGILMDDLFSEDNRLGIINWQKRFAPANDSKHISDATEYVLIYTGEKATRNLQTDLDCTVSSLWGMDDPCLDRARLCIGDVPLLAFPPAFYEVPFHLGCQSWRYEQSGSNQDATKLLRAITGADDSHLPMTPKPLKLIEKIIQLWCPLDGVVLDAFAGSGTTGHAVLDLNARIGSKRSFILIEQGNPATGDQFAQTLTAERLRRILTGAWATGLHAPLPGGFVFQRLMCVDHHSLEQAVPG